MAWLLNQVFEITGRGVLGLVAVGALKASILWGIIQTLICALRFKARAEAQRAAARAVRELEGSLARQATPQERLECSRRQGADPVAFFAVLVSLMGAWLLLYLVGLWVTLVLWGMVGRWPHSEGPIALERPLLWLSLSLSAAFVVKGALEHRAQLRRDRARDEEAGRRPMPPLKAWLLYLFVTALVVFFFSLAPAGLVFYWGAAIVVSTVLSKAVSSRLNQSAAASTAGALFGVF